MACGASETRRHVWWECVGTHHIRQEFPAALRLYQEFQDANDEDHHLGPLIEYGLVPRTPTSAAMANLRPDMSQTPTAAQLLPLLRVAVARWGLVETMEQIMRHGYTDGSTFFSTTPAARSGWSAHLQVRAGEAPPPPSWFDLQGPLPG